MIFSKFLHIILNGKFLIKKIFILEMKNSIDDQKIDIDKIFQAVGELTVYQLFLVFLIGNIQFLEPFVGYSYSFYGATPEHR